MSPEHSHAPIAAALCDEKHKRVDETMERIEAAVHGQGRKIEKLSSDMQLLSARVEGLPEKIGKEIRAIAQARKTEWTPRGIAALVVKIWPYILALLAAAGLGYGISPSAQTSPAPQVQLVPMPVPHGKHAPAASPELVDE